MKENREVINTNVGDIENSIEEDIERLERIDIKYFLFGSIEQNDYIVSKADEVNKAIEHILSAYKRVLKENEELKENNKYIIHLTDEQYNAVIENAQNDIKQKWIQKVKDKIEELKEQYNVRELDFIKTTQDIRKIIIQALEELLEVRKLEEDKL